MLNLNLIMKRQPDKKSRKRDSPQHNSPDFKRFTVINSAVLNHETKEKYQLDAKFESWLDPGNKGCGGDGVERPRKRGVEWRQRLRVETGVGSGLSGQGRSLSGVSVAEVDKCMKTWAGWGAVCRFPGRGKSWC